MMMVAAMTAFYMFRMYFLVFWWDNPDYEKNTTAIFPTTPASP